MDTNVLHRMALPLYHISLGSFIFIYFCTVLAIDASSIQCREEQLKQVIKYDIITPVRLEGRHRRNVNTLQGDGHLKEPSFILQILGEEYILDLHKNEMLFADGYMERTYIAGETPTNKLPHRTHHCYYHGKVRGSNSSRVALNTCHGLSGIIYMDGAIFYLEPLQDSSSEHAIYQPEHIIRDKPLYTFEEDYPEDFLERGEERLKELEKRHTERVRRDLNTETKYIEIVMVADSKEYERRGSVRAVEERIKAITNIIDMIYLPLNTRVVLASIIVWQDDPFEVSSNPSRALGQFQEWREQELVSLISHDNAQLITGLNFDGSTVGMAALSTMCSRDRSCGVSQVHGNHENDLASTISHEMGHNLGLSHDSGKECVCEAAQNIGCVMAASSGSNPPLIWSTCSVEGFQRNLERGLGACMFNYPKIIFGGPICQNGFIEEGEECDCGTVDECDNACCVAATCKLHENATCAIGECCENCQLKEQGLLCRDTMNECDLPEYCTGDNEECPSNVYLQNGVSCRRTINDPASCFNGMCISYDDQCQYIWGDGAKMAHQKCWRYNTQGSSFGNCGLNHDGNRVACSKSNKMCGKLLCEGGQGYPVLGSLASASQGFIYDENGNKRICKVASLDQGEDIPDPGYVADGSPCLENMFCYEYQCINRTFAGITPCPEDCNTHGICNSENHCHCNDNWAPPTCDVPGHGGSIDSGPTMPIPPVLTTVMVQTPHRTSPTSHPGSSRPASTSPTTAFSDFPGTKLPTTGNMVVAIVLGIILMAAVILLVVLIYWKRDAIKRKLQSKNIYSPNHPPPAMPNVTRSALKIQHPSHISGSSLSFKNNYAVSQEDLSPGRVAPEAPFMRPQHQTWYNGPQVVPSAPPIKYQKHDDAIMYDEPPNVDFVDPSIPRFNLPTNPAANHNGYVPNNDQVKRPNSILLAEEAVEPSISNQPPVPPIKPIVNNPLKPPSSDVVLKPTHTAPTPPPFKPLKNVEPEQITPSSHIPIKPPGQTQPSQHLQLPLKPPGQAPPKQPDQTPPKPTGQIALKPVGQIPLKPPGQIPLKPPGKIPFKPPGEVPLKPPGQIPTKPISQTPPSVLAKPVPASRKPVVPGKPSVPGKPVVPLKPISSVLPDKRPALRPPDQQKNWNNSASPSPSPNDDAVKEDNSVKQRDSFRGGSKPQLPRPPPPDKPNKARPTAPPKPVNV